MEFLLFVVVTIILVVVLGIRKLITDRFRILDDRLNHLSEELKRAQVRAQVQEATRKQGILEEGLAGEPSGTRPPAPTRPVVKEDTLEVPVTPKVTPEIPVPAGNKTESATPAD